MEVYLLYSTKIKDQIITQNKAVIARIGIDELEVSTTIGINPNELIEAQTIYVSLHFDIDITEVAKTDRIQDTLDYDVLSKQLIKWVQESNAKLLEALLYELKNKLIERYMLHNVYIKIKKPSALEKAKYVFIESNDNMN